MATAEDKLWLPVRLTRERIEPLWSAIAAALNNPPLYESTQRNVGLFHIERLVSPEGLKTAIIEHGVIYLQRVIQEAESKIHIRPVWTILEDFYVFYMEIIQLLVLIKRLHPDPAFVSAAREGIEEVQPLLDHVQFSHVIYKGLKKDTSPETDLEKHVSRTLLDRYELRGVSLEDEEERDNIMNLYGKISDLVEVFETNMFRPRLIDVKHFTAQQLKCLKLQIENDYVRVTKSHGLDMNHDMRLAGFVSYYLYDEELAEVLKHLIAARNQLAVALNFKTYKQMVLTDTALRRPGEVNLFIKYVNDGILPYAKKDFDFMARLKQKLDPDNPFCISDLEYIKNFAKLHVSGENIANLNKYLTLGACIDGLNKILEKSFFMRLDVNLTLADEVYNSDMYKLQIIQSNFGIIGYMFLDLAQGFRTSNKASHYIVREGKYEYNNKYIENLVWRPIRVVVKMSLENVGYPITFSIDEAEEFFAEIGKLMPQFLSVCKHQYIVRATTCLDYDALFSMLFRRFFYDLRAMKLIYKDVDEGTPLPDDTLNQIILSRKIFFAVELQMLVLKSTIDQFLYSEVCDRKLCDIFRRYDRADFSVPMINKCFFHLRDNYLVSEKTSGKFVDNLLMMALVTRVWDKYYKEDPFNSESSDTFIELVKEAFLLSNPTDCYAKLLNTKVTALGLAEILIDETIQRYCETSDALEFII